MGYNTDFVGQLSFASEPSRAVLAKINSILGKDIRDIDPNPSESPGEFCYIDLELLEDFSGIKWDGSEKTYDMPGIVNYLTKKVREVDPSFCLVGQLAAQGERAEDRWILKMVDGVATVVPNSPTGKKVRCPHCEEDFFVEL